MKETVKGRGKTKRVSKSMGGTKRKEGEVGRVVGGVG